MKTFRDKCCKLLQWVYLKINSEDLNDQYVKDDYFIMDIEEAWYINKIIVKDLTDGSAYFKLHEILFGAEFGLINQDFESLLKWIEHHSPSGKLTYTCVAILNNDNHTIRGNYKDEENNNGFTKSKYYKFVTVEDLTTDPYSNYAFTNTSDWVKSHLALIETLMRIYMQNLITQSAMAISLTHISGSEIMEDDVKTLAGADGALFWIVSIAAKSLTNLSIKNCSNWLSSHLPSENELQVPQEDFETDNLLRQLSLCNLVALLLNFYNPELATANNFQFNFDSEENFRDSSLYNLPTVIEFCSKYFDDTTSHLIYIASYTNGNFSDNGLAKASPNSRFMAAAVATELFYWLELRKRFKRSLIFYKTYDDRNRSNLYLSEEDSFKLNTDEITSLRIQPVNCPMGDSPSLKDHQEEECIRIYPSLLRETDKKISYVLDTSNESEKVFKNGFFMKNSSKKTEKKVSEDKNEVQVAKEHQKIRLVEGSEEPESVGMCLSNDLKNPGIPNIESPRVPGNDPIEAPLKGWEESINQLTTNIKQLQNDFGRFSQEQNRLLKKRRTTGDSSSSLSNSLSYQDVNQTIYPKAPSDIFGVQHPATLLATNPVTSPFYPISWYSQNPFRSQPAPPIPIAVQPMAHSWYNSWIAPAHGSLMAQPMSSRPPPHPYSSTDFSTPRSNASTHKNTSSIRKKYQDETSSIRKNMRKTSINSSEIEDDAQLYSDVIFNGFGGIENSRKARLRRRHRLSPRRSAAISLPDNLDEQRSNLNDELRLDLNLNEVSALDYAQHIISETDFDLNLNQVTLADFTNNNINNAMKSSISLHQNGNQDRDFPAQSFFVPVEHETKKPNTKISASRKTNSYLSIHQKMSQSSSLLSNRSKASLVESEICVKEPPIPLPKIQKLSARKSSSSSSTIEKSSNGFDPATIEALRKSSEARKLKMEEDKIKRDAIFKAYIKRRDSNTSKAPTSRRPSLSLPRPIEKEKNEDDKSMMKSFSRSNSVSGKSNRKAIANAIIYCCLAGRVNESAKNAALMELGSTDGKHFMILLRGGCQYHGLYRYDIEQNCLVRLMGNGPRIVKDDAILHYYKYDSGLKSFTEITTTSHLSTVIDAVMLIPKACRPVPLSNGVGRFISNSTSRLQ